MGVFIVCIQAEVIPPVSGPQEFGNLSIFKLSRSWIYSKCQDEQNASKGAGLYWIQCFCVVTQFLISDFYLCQCHLESRAWHFRNPRGFLFKHIFVCYPSG